MSFMKPSRNKPCPCGSGRKAKWCCTLKNEIVVARARQAVFAKIREDARRQREHLVQPQSEPAES